MSDERAVWTIVVAGGSGSRFGGDVPKQFVEVAGRRVIDWSIHAAASVSDGIVVVLPQDGSHTVQASSVPGPILHHVVGGGSRSESVRNGLAAVPGTADVVLVHDAARPVASAELFARVAAAVGERVDGVIPVVPVVDTVRDVNGDSVDRATLQAVQTPQGFSATALRNAHAAGLDATDDATLVQGIGGNVIVVAGERWNLKVTEPDDERVVTALLEARS